MCCFLHFFNISKTVTSVEKDFVPMHFVPNNFVTITSSYQCIFKGILHQKNTPQNSVETPRRELDGRLLGLPGSVNHLDPGSLWDRGGPLVATRDALRMFHRWGNPWANPQLNVGMSIWKISAACYWNSSWILVHHMCVFMYIYIHNIGHVHPFWLC